MEGEVSLVEPLFGEQRDQESDGQMDEVLTDTDDHNNSYPDDNLASFQTSDNVKATTSLTAEEIEEVNKCPVCGKVFTESFLLHDHMAKHSLDRRRFQCTLCSKFFNQKANLERHLETHSGERMYQCSYCDKGFVHYDVLRRHMRIHTGEKPHHCHVCGRNFRECSHLNIHMRTHTGERPYICQVCNKGFRQSGGLRRHEKTHGLVRKFHCPLCSEAFSSSSLLKEHRKNHPTGSSKSDSNNSIDNGSGTAQKCPVCDILVDGDMTEHMDVHVKEKPFICGICNKAYMQSKTLEIHMSKHAD